VDSNIDFYNQKAILGMGGIAIRCNWFSWMMKTIEALVSTSAI